MKITVLILLTICITTVSYAQKNTTKNWLAKKLKSADSILIISHHRTKGHHEIDSAGNEAPIQELVLNNKPNYAIVKERKLIKGKAIDSLIKILGRPSIKGNFALTGCFSPHHALFIFSGTNTSYLNICFDCHREESSEDLVKLPYFDLKRWDELKAFYINQGFTYQLK